jgi:hypothetical protein
MTSIRRIVNQFRKSPDHSLLVFALVLGPEGENLLLE